MVKHHFHLKADWPGGRNTVGELDVGNLKTSISIPKEMAGPGIGTNPDEMFLGAAATCYLITLAAMIERAQLPLKEMSHDAEAIVDVTNGVFTFEKIIHRPTVVLQAATNRQQRLLEKFVVKAEKTCMISKAIKGNVEIELEPNLSFK